MQKTCFGAIRSFFFYCSNWEEFVEKLVKSSDEFVTNDKLIKTYRKKKEIPEKGQNKYIFCQIVG